MDHPLLSAVISSQSDYHPDSVTVAQAQRIISAFVTPLCAKEEVSLYAALGRVLAKDIISPINVPVHDNSAMDGYAFDSTNLRDDAVISLKVVGTAYAGRGVDGTVGVGECVRIMTGAAIPAGCDTVVPQELTQQTSGDSVTIPPSVVKAGGNVRRTGEDLQLGTPALSSGKVMTPADIGLLASLGIANVPVQRRLRVAFFSTGDELRSIGETLDAGCVYDSNRYTLYGMLTRLGCDVIDMGVVRDNPAVLETALRSACMQADVIITSGGVSVGAADHVKQAMEQLGEVAFWKIRMRPGHPLAFGAISCEGKSACLFGLPGNPVAVMVTFLCIVRNALLQLMGANSAPLPLLRVTSQCAIRKKAGRTEFQRGILSADKNGNQQVRITGSQGSGILRSMSEANCLIVLQEDIGNVNAGDPVDVLLFDGLI
jgi:molybdopterin molybdotransferase